jgi:hypothetical protein
VSDTGTSWALAPTCRCLTEDLDLLPADCERPVVELVGRHRVVADFNKKRTDNPIGTEPPIGSLLRKKVPAYSLHSGRYRAATWHHERAGIVWLLAARWHEQGSPDDAYPYFESLLDAGRLLPTREDVARVVNSRRLTFERALVDRVPGIRSEALEQPGVVRDAVIGGRIRVRVVYENGESGILWVAVVNRLIPGDMPVPSEWLVQVLAAFFPGVPLAEIEYTEELAGRASHPDEDCFCALVSRDRSHDDLSDPEMNSAR